MASGSHTQHSLDQAPHWTSCVVTLDPSPAPISVEVQAHHIPGLLMAYEPVMAHYRSVMSTHMERQRRQIVLQALLAVHAACLILPLVSAPLGGVIAAGCSAEVVRRMRVQLSKLRQRQWYWHQPLRPLMLNLACTVLRTLRAHRGLSRTQLPSTHIRLGRLNDGGYRIWLQDVDSPCAVAFARALSDALGPVGGHRFVIRPPGDAEVASGYPVPHSFGAARRVARIYALNWWRIFGVGQLVCLRDADTGVVSQLVEEAQTASAPHDLIFRPSPLMLGRTP